MSSRSGPHEQYLYPLPFCIYFLLQFSGDWHQLWRFHLFSRTVWFWTRWFLYRTIFNLLAFKALCILIGKRNALVSVPNIDMFWPNQNMNIDSNDTFGNPNHRHPGNDTHSWLDHISVSPTWKAYIEICRSSFRQGNGGLTHFGWSITYAVGTRKKKTHFVGLFFLPAFGRCCPLVSARPAKVLFCT